MRKHILNTPAVYRWGIKCIRYIPTYISYPAVHLIADLSFLLYKSSAEKIMDNFRTVFPDASHRELSRKARQLFRNYAEYLVDYGRFTELDKETLLTKIIHFDGEENLISALNMKKGMILLTAHLGNWELGGIFFSAYGLHVNVLTLPDEDPEIHRRRSMYREQYGVRTVTVGDSPFSSVSLVNALSNNEVVAMLIDRYSSDRDSVTADIFGRPARFPKGPFVLSRVTGAPVVVAFVVKENGAYTGIIEEPFTVSREDREEQLIAKVVTIFEKYIVKYCDQWYDFR